MTNVCGYCLVAENLAGVIVHAPECQANEIERLRQQVAALVLQRDAAEAGAAALRQILDGFTCVCSSCLGTDAGAELLAELTALRRAFAAVRPVLSAAAKFTPGVGSMALEDRKALADAMVAALQAVADLPGAST